MSTTGSFIDLRQSENLRGCLKKRDSSLFYIQIVADTVALRNYAPLRERKFRFARDDVIVCLLFSLIDKSQFKNQKENDCAY